MDGKQQQTTGTAKFWIDWIQLAPLIIKGYR
jgi:hypothetical protein